MLITWLIVPFLWDLSPYTLLVTRLSGATARRVTKDVPYHSIGCAIVEPVTMVVTYHWFSCGIAGTVTIHLAGHWTSGTNVLLSRFILLLNTVFVPLWILSQYILLITAVPVPLQDQSQYIVLICITYCFIVAPAVTIHNCDWKVRSIYRYGWN